MFCKDCGKDNDNHALYCGNDGIVLGEKSNKLKLSKTITRFCKDCGEPITSYDLYCKNCGSSLFEKSKSIHGVSKFEKDHTNDKELSARAKNIGQFDFKESFVHAALGFIIILLISLTISTAINKVIQEELLYDIGTFSDFKAVNFLDITMLFNCAKLNVGIFNGNYTLIDGSVSGIPFIALLIPFLIFFLIGVFKARKNNKLNQNFELKEILLTALFYGVLISFLSLIASSNKDMFMPYLNQRIVFKKKYVLFASLINSILISGLPLLLGYSFYEKTSNSKNRSDNFKELFNASFIFFISAFSVCLAVAIYSKLQLKDQLPNDIFDLLIIAQMGIYAFLMINFGTFKFIYELDLIDISLFNNIGILKEDLGSGGIIFLFLLVLIPVFLFYSYGRKVKRTGRGNILYSSIFYSLLMGILAYLTYGIMSGSGGLEIFDGLVNYQINFGFKFYYSIISSFMLSILSSSAGYFLSKDNKSEVSGIE